MPKITPSTTDKDDLPFVIAHKTASILILALLIFSFALFGWWKNIYNSPHNVFNGMLTNNLSTSSVTRETNTNENGADQKRVETLSFVPENSVRSVVSIKQSENGQNNEVSTETIGTLREDYSKYLTIKTNQKNQAGKALDYSSIQNIWSKSDPLQEKPQYFSQSALGLMLFANLDGNTRQQAIKLIQDKKAYDVNYSEVKPLKINGKSALVYPVKVNLEAYVQAVQIVAKQIGLSDLANLDPSSYKDQPPVEIKLTVDKISRQLIRIEYSGDQIETYSAYGINTPVSLPSKTISAADLQQKVQEIQ